MPQRGAPHAQPVFSYAAPQKNRGGHAPAPVISDHAILPLEVNNIAQVQLGWFCPLDLGAKINIPRTKAALIAKHNR